MGVDSAKGNNQKRLQQHHRILLLQQYSFAQTKNLLFDFPRDKSAFILRLGRQIVKMLGNVKITYFSDSGNYKFLFQNEL